MRVAAKTSAAFLLLISVLSSAVQNRLTTKEARRLAVAGMPKEAKGRGVTIELDREQSGCAIYHAYSIGGSFPEFNSATLGWWSVDLKTGEVWDELNSRRIASAAIMSMQRDFRKRLGISDIEISATIANPCYERYTK